jgi:ubiquinone/menaquinone biosynthesis C-methylase UbiE
MLIYDKIGKGYNTTRRADPYITERIFTLLNAATDGLYIDVGCGTGNYLNALCQKGLQFYGVEPSAIMLNEAKAKGNNAVFIQSKIEELSLPDSTFDGAVAIFTIHHWDNKIAGLKQISRILKPGARLVMLSFTPEQLLGYWLCHYFPKTMENSCKVVSSSNDMKELFLQCGFSSVSEELYFVQPGLQDHFLYSNKFRPERYLIPEIRNGASSFTVYAAAGEVEGGLIALEKDINSGKIHDIMKQYENEKGDYLFFVAEK